MKVYVILSVREQAEAAPSKEIVGIRTNKSDAELDILAFSEAEARKPEDERCGRFEIEEHDLNLGIKVAVEVSGGLVQNIYASTHAAPDIDADVYDLDVSDFPDDGEQEAADERAAELQKLADSAEYVRIW